MVSSIQIGNFKAFADVQRIPLRPITLLFGPNSSGKSSIIHSLILAHQGIVKGDLDVNRSDIGGESVDLGGFSQYIFRREAERHLEFSIELRANKFDGRLKEIFQDTEIVSIGLTVGLGFDTAEFDDPRLEQFLSMDIDEFVSTVDAAVKFKKEDISEGLISLRNSFEKYRYRSLKVADTLDKAPEIKTYRIDADTKNLLRMSKRKGRHLQLDTLDTDHPIMKGVVKAIVQAFTTTDIVTEGDYQSLQEAIGEIVPKITCDLPAFLPNGIRKDQVAGETGQHPLIAVSKGRRSDDLGSAAKLYVPRIIDEMIRLTSEQVKLSFQKMKYLGPLRSYPPRHLAFSQYHDSNWNAGGGFAWEQIRTKPALREKINEWLSDANRLKTPYELVVQHLLTIDDFEKPYAKRIAEIEDEFVESGLTDIKDGVEVQGDLFGELYGIPKGLKAVESTLSEIKELVLVDKRTETVVSHRDVGIGISQVLPVLVSLYGNRNSVIAIEQPEIHLHPKMQAELGDVIIESALGNNSNTLLIETHSEHVILRLLRRIRETSSGELKAGLIPVEPKDVSVLYVQPTPAGSIVKELRITAEGEFADKWPDGFFTERAEELF